jgi:hypothetical protein
MPLPPQKNAGDLPERADPWAMALQRWLGPAEPAEQQHDGPEIPAPETPERPDLTAWWLIG